MFDKVLILSASSGAGHVRAAQAVEAAFERTGSAREVKHLDTLKFTTRLFRNLYSKAYIEMIQKAPEVLGWIYDVADKPWKNERRRLAFDRLNTMPFVKMLTSYQPEITVCTHFLPAEIISWLKAKRRLDTRQAIVVTDLDVHAMWLCHHYEHYFVALDETRVHLEKLGIAPTRITTSGIPIDPMFAESRDKSEMRRKHGLSAGKTTILVTAGGYGVGRVDRLITSLAELKHPSQVVIVCGANVELKQHLEDLTSKSLPASAKTVEFKVLGFTDVMHEYMAASDLLLGKAGGLTTAEALASGLVLAIVDPIPGQEERNADHLLEEGVAIRCNNLPTLGYKLDRLLEDKQRFNQMATAVKRLARPRAAYDIVSKLISLKEDGWKS